MPTETLEARQPTPASLAQRINAPVSQLLAHPWVASLVSPAAVEDTLRAVHPMLSLTEVRAKVQRVMDETPSTKTFVLRPNALWQGASAGQFVRVHVEIAGRQESRMYSLTSRPGARHLAITVQRQAHGRVSGYLHDHLRAGDVLTLSRAMGEFVLPAQLPKKILLLGAGSGITPLMSMLRDLKARGYRGDVVLLQVYRSPEERIFAQALAALVADFPQLTLVSHCTSSAGRLGPDGLHRLLPDLAQRSTWVCGPGAWMDAMHAYWQASGFPETLHSERFVAYPILPLQETGTPVVVTWVASGQRLRTHGNAPLLVQAEQQGLSPKHGCRIGICRSCQCTKISGTVQNLQTGEISCAPNEPIRLCISAARTDVSLDL